MKLNNITFIIFFCFMKISVFSQTTITGLVLNSNHEKLYPVFIELSSNKKIYNTNFEGLFSFNVINITDTLKLKCSGYDDKLILVSVFKNDTIPIILEEKIKTLSAIEVKWKNPISEKFSISTLKPLDIYLNPNSMADPLKAINMLAASTNTDESAAPSLRGSDGDKSRVYLNGVPIYNPSRNNPINGTGSFSIINTEIIRNENIYASNPPLTFGNCSAGLIEINTINILEKDKITINTSLANIGLFYSKKLNEKKFVQLYSNHQFSKPFISINKKSMAKTFAFQINDIGVNFNCKISNKISFNTYNYLTNESYSGEQNILIFQNKINQEKIRFFSINNFTLRFKKSLITLNNGSDFSIKKMSFGNIILNNAIQSFYNSINYRKSFSSKISFQLGSTYDKMILQKRDSIPVYYFLLEKNSPSYFNDSTIQNDILESYFYLSLDINSKMSYSFGVRNNIPINNQSAYLSHQNSINYKFNSSNIILFSQGAFYSYTTPNYPQIKDFYLIRTDQFAIDFTHDKNYIIKLATYYKNEEIKSIHNKVESFGAEFSIEKQFHSNLIIKFSNLFLEQKITNNGIKFNGYSKMNYFIKFLITYTIPKLFILNLTYQTRPGLFYTPIVDKEYIQQINVFAPVFAPVQNTSKYNSYNNLDLSLTKVFKIKGTIITSFLTLNNILNIRNVNNLIYSNNYSISTNNFYQTRSIYFGFVFNPTYKKR